MKVHVINKWFVGSGKTEAGPVVLFQFDLPGSPKTTIAIHEEAVGELAQALLSAASDASKKRN